MAIAKSTKMSVIEDWQRAFPQLSLYGQNKLYKIIGPVIMGLELIKLPGTERYRPHFVIYPLWQKDIKKCLNGPFILKEYKNGMGFQYSIPYEEHHVLFNDVIGQIKRQTPLSFDLNISLAEMATAIDEYSTVPPLSAAPNSYLQAFIQEVKLKIFLFMGSIEAQIVMAQIVERNWDINHFKACGVDVDKWLFTLQEEIFHREEFLKLINLNKQDKKIAKLKSSELVI